MYFDTLQVQLAIRLFPVEVGQGIFKGSLRQRGKLSWKCAIFFSFFGVMTHGCCLFNICTTEVLFHFEFIIIIIHSFYIALFSALKQTHCAHWHVILNEWLYPFIVHIINIHGSGVLIALFGCCMAGATWNAAVSAQVLCTPLSTLAGLQKFTSHGCFFPRPWKLFDSWRRAMRWRYSGPTWGWEWLHPVSWGVRIRHKCKTKLVRLKAV